MFLMLSSRHVEGDMRPHLQESALEMVQMFCCTDFMDARSRRDMEKKTTSLSQQQFFLFQSLMKNMLTQFKPVS